MALRAAAPANTPRSLLHVPSQSSGLLKVTSVACDALVEAEPQALGLTYWFDVAPNGEPYTAVVRFVGHRVGIDGEARPEDRFVVSERVDPVLPGSGRVAITTRLVGIASGEWNVTASLIAQQGHGGAARTSTGPTEPHVASASGATGFGPIIGVRAPGAHLGVWPALVTVGVAVALAAQSLLATHAHLPAAPMLSMSLMACVVGLVGARIYYLAEHDPRALLTPRTLLSAGMCVQGFVLAAIASASIGMAVVGVSVGQFLDVSAPGMLFGMGFGRLGCFFGGCCTGRPTASRWGLWSSDRRVGTRRIPTQPMESALAFTVGVIALLAVLSGAVEPAGTVFVGAIASHTLGRQLLFPWRDLPRKTSNGRTLTAAVTAAVALAAIAVAVFR
jgi:phosphatidylglycerol:prolipoprotein diacylglycerol transferase